MVRCTDRPAMTIAVDLGRKATKQTNLSRSVMKRVMTMKRGYLIKLISPVTTKGFRQVGIFLEYLFFFSQPKHTFRGCSNKLSH